MYLWQNATPLISKKNEVETVGKKERFRRNIMAIQLLKKCQEENRFATLEEQIILSKYVGWGGLSEAFDEIIQRGQRNIWNFLRY